MMSITINYDDLNIKNNIMYLNTKLFNIQKINKIVARGIKYKHLTIETENITSNHLFNIYHLINTIEFYRSLNVYFSLYDILYNNIHNVQILNSFAFYMQSNSDNCIYINSPINNNNNYVIISNSQEIQDTTNNIFIYNILTMQSILSLYNQKLFRILNLMRLISGGFFLHEYMQTEYIEFSYTNYKNIYFDNIIHFITYCNSMHIHIENEKLYQECYKTTCINMFHILCKYFNVSNISFNLPNNIEVIHHNFWIHTAYVHELYEEKINCLYYKKYNHIELNEITQHINIKSSNRLLYAVSNSYNDHINNLLNDSVSLHTIYHNNILPTWQMENIRTIWHKLTFKNNKILYQNESIYICAHNSKNYSKYKYIYNIDNGNLTFN